MKTSILIFLSAICLSCGCNSNYRDSIVFRGKFIAVQDSLIKITELIKKFKSPINSMKGYYYQQHNLFVNGAKINPAKIDTVNSLANLDLNHKKYFLSLSKYLNNNFISAGYFDTSTQLWSFVYKDLPDGGNREMREICLVRNGEEKQLSLILHIYDHKDMIYLVGYPIN